jgi:hypothetical protein
MKKKTRINVSMAEGKVMHGDGRSQSWPMRISVAGAKTDATWLGRSVGNDYVPMVKKK